jgi:hypothetical protein
LAGDARTRQIQEIQGEFLAIDTALASLKSGDLCLILIDQVEEALAHIVARIKSGWPMAVPDHAVAASVSRHDWQMPRLAGAEILTDKTHTVR